MFQRVGDISIFLLTGDLDPFEGRQLMQSLANLIRRDWVKIVLDFERVEHVNYQVMAELVSLGVASHSGAGQIKLANISPYHRNLLRVAGVDEFFETYDSLGEAILSFEAGYASSASAC